jgi:dTDP-glucose 4,6-dehydratase
MRLVVTGGAGFIGSAVVCRALHDGHTVLTVDKLTYAGRLDALSEVSASPRHHFLKADVADSAAMEAAFIDFEPDAVLHLAAESHVDRSIDSPDAFINTNINGTFVLLEAALRCWSRRRGRERGRFTFVHISTDEVFGALGETGCFDLGSRYAPSSPYAASKAAADHLARVWHRTYGLPVIVTNCSNNYGPRQHPEKLIPTVIRHALAGEPIPIYGNGQNIRDWLHVDDHADGLMATLRQGRPGETYLFGGRCDVRNLDLAHMICGILDVCAPRHDGKRYAENIDMVSDRPGHDFRYSIDPSHAENILGWRANKSLEAGLATTIDWYLGNPDWLIPGKILGRLGSRSADVMGAIS